MIEDNGKLDRELRERVYKEHGQKASVDINKYTYGGNGSHWNGCEESHWDCKIRALEAQVKDLQEYHTLGEQFREASHNLVKELDDKNANFVSRLKEVAGEIERQVKKDKGLWNEGVGIGWALDKLRSIFPELEEK